jgi:opacity protein-like surface antigen
MLKKVLISALFAAFAAPALAADNNNVYIGGDIGSSRIDGFGSKKSFGGFAGYQIDSNLAVEVGYRKFATISAYKLDVNFKQTSVSVLGSYPLGNGVYAFGRLGYNHLKATVSEGKYSGSASDSGILLGAGVGYQINQNFSTRLELQRPSSDSKNLSVSVAYKF